MEAYNYNFEIRRCILHFMSALDGAVVKRYDKNQKALDVIKVNYVYGPKESIYKDLIDKAEHTKLPVVSIFLTSIRRDQTRITEKNVPQYYDSAVYNQNYALQIQPPVPVNLTFSVTIIAKYQSDLEQILTNFISYSNPYFIVSWREPITNRELRSEILWDGSVSIETPKELTGKEQYSRVSATTSFEFKGWIFKSEAEPIGKICQIDTNYHLTDTTFCDYNHFVDYSPVEESLTLDGLPKVEWADPIVIKTGYRPRLCDGDVDENIPVKGKTESVKIFGKFIDVTDVFLSADSDELFLNDTMSAVDIFKGNDNFPPFRGVLVNSFPEPISQVDMTIPVPELSGSGYVDVIVVSRCGYSILSNDRKTRQDPSDNPYPDNHELFNVWNKFNDPFKNGIEVVDTSLDCNISFEILATVDDHALETSDEKLMAETIK